MILSSALMLTACLNKEYFEFDKISETSWNPKVAIPLLKGEVGVYQLFGATDSNAVNINGKDIKLIYGGKKASFQLNNVVAFQDVSTPNGPLGYTTNPTLLPPIPFDVNGTVQIQSVLLSAGELTIATSNGNGTDQITFEFLDIKNEGGTALRVEVTAGETETRSLNNYSIEPTNGEIRIQIQGSNTGSCDGQIEIKGLDYQSVTGDFSTAVQRVGEESFQLHLFKNIAAKGDIEVSNPILAIEASNSFGFSILPVFDSVFATNPASNDIIPLVKNPNVAIGEIKASTKSGEFVNSRIELNGTNSNLSRFIGISPKTITYNLGMQAGNNPPAPQTVFKDSKCDLSISLELPLEGKISAFEVLDTIDMQVTTDLTLIKEFVMKTYTNNGFPLETNISLILMNEKKQIMTKADGSPMVLLDELFTAAAPVDGSGVVTSSAESSIEHQLVDEEVLASLPLARFVQLRASMNTSNFGKDIIKIQSDYKLEVSVGIKLTGNINLLKDEEE